MSHDRKSKWKIYVKYFFGVVLCVMALWGGYVLCYGYYSESLYTCSRCRAVKRDETFWGIHRVTIIDGEFSKWYIANHGDHVHHWCYGGYSITKFIGAVAYSCGKRHPIWYIDEVSQQLFLENATPEEIILFYEYADSQDTDMREKLVSMVMPECQ
jgi:hypothetical protein